ncbi:hypothetical protein JDM601_1130 [Mycolicibacter sinensis]|uniref:Uncharacterized protein n=1 Tax=Mycolicibacter sinensis (strain JDM601) TaxID=875328 RepID=F5YV77_MYCSD|nr:hypothetical protein JDM601_1130 [Mycolicibacter sinensis]
MPDPHHLVIGRDRPGAPIDIGVSFDYKDFQTITTEEVRGGSTGGSIADHGDVINGHAASPVTQTLFCSVHYGSVAITTVSIS